MDRWGKRSSIQLLMGKKILPMVLVVVSMSGICEPRTAKPRGKGSAVPRTRDVPDSAIALVSNG